MLNQKRQRLHVCTCSTCQKHPYSAVAQHHKAINRVLATLDEKNRRRFAGVLALQGGRGSILPLSRITGLSRHTIRRGKRDIAQQGPTRTQRLRRAGGGRPPAEKNVITHEIVALRREALIKRMRIC
jgi:hypothetical protein